MINLESNHEAVKYHCNDTNTPKKLKYRECDMTSKMQKGKFIFWVWNVSFLLIQSWHALVQGFPFGSVVRNLPASAGEAGDVSSIPRSGRSPGRGHGNLLEYSCLGNPIDRGAQQAIVGGVTKNQTLLSNCACTRTLVYQGSGGHFSGLGLLSYNNTTVLTHTEISTSQNTQVASFAFS